SRCKSRGENNQEALAERPADAAGNLPLRGDELLPKKRILRNQFNATANEIRSQPGNEPKKIDHVSSLTPSTRGWNLPGRGTGLIEVALHVPRSSPEHSK